MQPPLGRMRALVRRWAGPAPSDDLRRRVEELETDVTRLRRELGAAIEYFDRLHRPESGS